MIKLYDHLPSGNGYKVCLLLSRLSIPFERIGLDINAGETRTAEFLERNSAGRIPLVQLESGDYLSESDAVSFFWPKYDVSARRSSDSGASAAMDVL